MGERGPAGKGDGEVGTRSNRLPFGPLPSASAENRPCPSTQAGQIRDGVETVPTLFMVPTHVQSLEVFTSHEPGTAGILAGVAVRTQYAGRDAGGPNDSLVHGR